jgi:hypothetical protein
VHRPLEFGASAGFKPAPATDFDVVAADVIDLANRLGA